MTGKIHVLAETLSQVIAAGEVIERPASVVKELMENAIDARASEVLVELKAGGLQLIRVQDNGEGIEREDTSIALQRHATSKIESIEDLYAIRTLGFRGEALPSIASVSHLVIKTRTRNSNTGTRVICEGGEIQSLTDAGCPVGTEVEVRNLFFNVPVKRKFLKSISLELRHALGHFVRLSLSRPGISFRLIHDGRLLHEHLRTDSLKVRAEAILGRETYNQLQSVEYEDGELSLSGLASLPTFSRGNGDGIHLYVNQRFVKDRAIYKAVVESYRHVIPQGRFPSVILFLTLPRSAVDVNVHPTKMEVKFRESEKIFSAVYSALHSLHEPFPSRSSQEKLHNSERSLPETETMPLSFPRSMAYPQGRFLETEGRGFNVNETDRQGWSREKSASLRVLGQALKTYIVCEDEEGLVLIDQHAAHERIRFEELKRAYETRSVPILPLLTPLLMECSPEEGLALTHHLRDFQTLGFDIDPVGERVFAIRSVPVLIGRENPEEVIRKILEGWAFGPSRGKDEEGLHTILVTLSCHSAIRGNFEMRREEMEELVTKLVPFSLATTCPHGRPIFFRIRTNDLERKFKRNPR